MFFFFFACYTLYIYYSPCISKLILYVIGLQYEEKVNFKSQILERPSIGKYWNILCVPVSSGNVIFTSFRTCWWHPEENNTGTPKWSSIVQYSCTSIWEMKYTFSFKMKNERSFSRTGATHLQKSHRIID